MDKKSKLDEKVIKRFNELIEKGQDVLNTRHSRSNEEVLILIGNGVEYETSHQWGLSCLSLLKRIFGPESDHYKRFDELDLSDFSPIKRGMGIIKSAKDEYEKGFLFEMKKLIEVFHEI